MYYIYILNDIVIEDVTFEAKEIADFLLNTKTWIYSTRAPFINSIKSADKILVYLAGKGRRYFYASFEILDNIEENDLVDSRFSQVLSMFKLKSKINNIEIKQRIIPIKEVLNKLEFICDKKNYGLYFRQSIKKINQNDYLLLMNK